MLAATLPDIARIAAELTVLIDAFPAHLQPVLAASGLKSIQLAGRQLLPIVQGGMGIGASAHRLAGAVAAQGGVGTLNAVDLRRHHPDLMARTSGLSQRNGCDADGLGLIAMNIMRAVSEYAAYVKRSLEHGIDRVVVGAGPPLDLPDLAVDHAKALLVPMLSVSRGVALIVKKWERKRRLPVAIVIEHPRLAGGHLGVARIIDLSDPRFEFDRVIPESLAFLRQAGLDGRVPLLAAGGIRSHDDIGRIQALGGAGVQLGTPLAVTTDGDASDDFKKVPAEARDEDMVEFSSVAGLPARAAATPWLRAYLKLNPKPDSPLRWQ